jgi:hypothetical protein
MSFEHQQLLPKGEVTWVRETISESQTAMLLVRLQVAFYESQPVLTRADDQGVEIVVPRTETHGYAEPAMVPSFQVFAWRLPVTMMDKPAWIYRLDHVRRRLLKPDEVVEPTPAPTPSPSVDLPRGTPPCPPPPYPTAYYPCPSPVSPAPSGDL